MTVITAVDRGSQIEGAKGLFDCIQEVIWEVIRAVVGVLVWWDSEQR